MLTVMKKIKLVGLFVGGLVVGTIATGWWSGHVFSRLTVSKEVEFAFRAAEEADWLALLRLNEPKTVIEQLEHSIDGMVLTLAAWDEVKALQKRGFEIGAHTRTHVDLGSVAGRDAQREIAGAREDLESALGARVESFAYPFGTPNHLTEANRAYVKSAGFRCCCSAFGGTISRATDPFHIPRVPISTWHPYPYQFGFDVSLGRSVDPPSSKESDVTCCATSEATGF